MVRDVSGWRREEMNGRGWSGETGADGGWG
jgi:hypothetical protein